MANIYPPIIDRVLPPIIRNGNDFIFKIPMKNNIFYSASDCSKTLIKITPLLGNRYNMSKTIEVNKPGVNTTLIQATINGSTNELQDFIISSQFYKIQLAYKNNGSAPPSSYSTIGIAKCIQETDETGDKKIAIKIREDDGSGTINYFNCNNTFTGEYINIEDAAERVIAYQFDILKNGNIYETSGKMPHNAILMGTGEIDNNGKLVSTDIFHTKRILENDGTYSIRYTIYTINGYEATTISDLNIELTEKVNFNGKIYPEVKYDNGYINIKLKSLSPSSNLISGTYLLSRSSSEDNYKIWEWMAVKNIPNSTKSIEFWKDFTVEQGVFYKYGIQGYDNNTKKPLNDSEKSESIQADFEDIFLFDGERSLKIRYNQKVDNFKIMQLENKTDTIGGHYPFLSKNGNIEYKTFSISGLICSQMDDFNYFTLNTDSYIYTSGYTADNIKKERDFKLQVLEWLTNGKPKLFRSPTEGNYIIILQNVSLSSNDSLGRLLHSFSATAYEICEYTVENLKKYNIINNNILDERIPIFGIQEINILDESGESISYTIGNKRNRTNVLPIPEEVED